MTLVFLVHLFSPINTAGQKSVNSYPAATFHSAIEANAVDFTTDKLQNVYVLTEKQDILKYNSSGVLQFRYSNKTHGTVGYIDATDPFHILVFYPDFQKAVILDRTMSQMVQMSFQEWGYFRVSVVAMSSDARIWIYDEERSRLRKVSSSGQTLLESGELNLQLGKTIQPNYLMESNQAIFLNVPDLGIIVFDTFGKYLKTIPIRSIKYLQVTNEMIHFIEDGIWQIFELRSLTQTRVNLPELKNSVQKVRIEKDRIYILEGNVVKIFRF